MKLGLLFSTTKSPKYEEEVQQGREAMEAIFGTPKHKGLPSAKASNKSSIEFKPTEIRPPPLLSPLSELSSHEKKEPTPSVHFTKTNDSTDHSWKLLPPCPIAGYRLTSDGLIDERKNDITTPIVMETEKEKKNGRWCVPYPWRGFKGSHDSEKKLGSERVVLSTSELKQLIHELRRMEQESKMVVDEDLPNQVRRRSLRGLEIVINPCLLLTGIYLMTWRSAQLYRSALPRRSFFLTKFLNITRWHLSVRQKEEASKRHRQLLRATNAQVASSFLTGAGLTAFAWITRPTNRVVDEAPDVLMGRQREAMQQHTSSALKWMWFVYFHHPSYSGK